MQGDITPEMRLLKARRPPLGSYTVRFTEAKAALC
jgi:hypothetical protein